MHAKRVVEKLSVVLLLAIVACLATWRALDNAHAAEPAPARPGAEAPAAPDVKTLMLPAGEEKDLKLLHPKSHVWMDKERKRLVMSGHIALREGQLEMFACLSGTKEHESVVAIDTEAQVVHAGLLVCGAEPGKPVQFQPTFSPASGTEIEITLHWKDKDGKLQTARAQDWIRDIKTQKEMQQNWVFAGSGFWTDDRTGEKYYMAEDGDFVCVSNFASAMLDLPTESSQSAGALLFEAFTDRIPPQGSPVTMILTPKVEKKDEEKNKDEKQTEEKATTKDPAKEKTPAKKPTA